MALKNAEIIDSYKTSMEYQALQSEATTSLTQIATSLSIHFI